MTQSFSPIPPATPQTIQRLHKHTHLTSHGCKEWQRWRNKAGYGTMAVGGKLFLVHRLAYSWFVGPIPEGYVIDHLCRNPACLNPLHLDAVPHMENVRRGKKGPQERCSKGHEFTPENSLKTSNGRRCRACHYASLSRRRKKARAERNKGRSLTYGGHPSPLTRGQAEEIRIATGSYREIGLRYGVTHTTVRKIKIGKTWQKPAEFEDGEEG